jgi:cell division protein FtsL
MKITPTEKVVLGMIIACLVLLVPCLIVLNKQLKTVNSNGGFKAATSSLWNGTK